MKKIIESPTRMYIIILISGILGIAAGECFGQAISPMQWQKAPGSSYIPYSTASGSWSYTPSSSIIPSISGLVPYTGATSNVNLGSNNVSAQNFSITGTSGAGVLFMRAQAGGTITAGSTPGIKFYSNNAGNLMWKRKPNIGNDTNTRTFAGTLTANHNYTLKDADGTLAFTSDIPSYSVTSPLTFSANVFGITQAGSGADGYLSGTDWNTFNGKQSALGFTPENISNKTTSFGTLNNTLYPTTQAVSSYITGLGYLTVSSAATTYAPLTRSITVNGQTFDLSANRTYTTGDALTTQPLSQFASTTSSQLAGVISDEIGTGRLVYNTAPTFTTSITSPLVYGSSSSAGTLTLSSTSNATKGKILFGTSGYDEVNNRLGIGNTSPAYALDVTGMVQSSTGFISNGTCQLTQVNGFTNNLQLYGKLSNGKVIIGYNAGANITASFDSNGMDISTGNAIVSTAGKGLVVKGGTNSRIGTATLSGGTVTVANTSVTANSRVFVMPITGANAGTLSYSVTAGTSFTITSSNASDARSVSWFIVEEN